MVLPRSEYVWGTGGDGASSVKTGRGKEQEKNLHFLVWLGGDKKEEDTFPSRWDVAARKPGRLYLLTEWDPSAEKQLGRLWGGHLLSLLKTQG